MARGDDREYRGIFEGEEQRSQRGSIGVECSQTFTTGSLGSEQMKGPRFHDQKYRGLFG